MKNILNAKSGFTTIELMVSVTIVSLLSLVCVQTLFATQMVWGNSYVHAHLESEVSRSIHVMNRYIREADPSSGIQVYISPAQDLLRFAIPKTVAGGSNTISEWTQVQFSYNSATQKITKTVGPNSEIIGRLINQCQFSQTANKIIISLSASTSTADGRILTIPIQTQVTMRN